MQIVRRKWAKALGPHRSDQPQPHPPSCPHSLTHQASSNPPIDSPSHQPTSNPRTNGPTYQQPQKHSHWRSPFFPVTAFFFVYFPHHQTVLSQPLAEKEWETDGHGRGFEILGWGWRYCGAVGAGAGDMTITSSSAPFPSLPWRRRAARCR